MAKGGAGHEVSWEVSVSPNTNLPEGDRRAGLKGELRAPGDRYQCPSGVFRSTRDVRVTKGLSQHQEALRNSRDICVTKWRGPAQKLLPRGVAEGLPFGVNDFFSSYCVRGQFQLSFMCL